MSSSSLVYDFEILYFPKFIISTNILIQTVNTFKNYIYSIIKLFPISSDCLTHGLLTILIPL